MRPFLHVTLLLLCFAADCLAIRHIPDSGNPHHSAVILEVPKDNDHSLSITVNSGKTWNPLRIHVSTKDIKDPMKFCGVGDDVSGARRPNFYGYSFPCHDVDVLTHTKKVALLQHIIPSAAKMHMERLLVKPMKDPIMVSTLTQHGCSQFTVPDEHKTQGLSNTDFVLYVAAGPESVFAIPCAQLENKRPVVGVMNIAPREITQTRHAVRRVAHEMTHALGFHWKVIKELGLAEERSGKKYTTAKAMQTIKDARVHFKCDTLEELTLEHESVYDSMHWGRRYAKEELMSVVIDDTAAYSVLTLALLEDTGFFKAVWEKTERMRWGSGATCEFFSKTCNGEAQKSFPNAFCTYTAHKQCSSDRYSRGTCSDNDATSHCNFIKSEESEYCVDFSIGGSLGNRRCVERVTGTQSKAMDAVCVEVSCIVRNKSLMVRFTPNGNFTHCPTSGKVKNGDGEDILCPKYDEVCPLSSFQATGTANPQGAAVSKSGGVVAPR